MERVKQLLHLLFYLKFYNARNLLMLMKLLKGYLLLILRV